MKIIKKFGKCCEQASAGCERPEAYPVRDKKQGRHIYKWMALLMTLCMLLALVVTGCGSDASESESADGQNVEAAGSNGVVKVYNWGEYIDEDTITQFEEETGIKVIYDLFETNEEMYPVIAAGGVSYDVVCPSDYMIEKMIENDLLQPINYDNIPNTKYLEENIMELAAQYDPGNTYSIPYTYGTLGILYNTTMVDDPVDSWSIMWDEKYDKDIIMYNSVRDLFVAPLRLLDADINTTDPEILEEALDLLKEEKNIVQGYYMDQIKELMVNNGAALAMVYSGEVLALQEVNPDLEYVIPKEGSNFFVDAWVIPANAENVENAEAFLDFMNRPDIAAQNFEYVTYGIPHSGAKEYIDQDILDNPAVFPDPDSLVNCQVYDYLGDEEDAYYNELWLELKGTDVS